MNPLCLFIVMFREFIRDFRQQRREMRPMDAGDIKGKVVVITGANSGIGKYCAMDFAKRGATVIMACRNLEKSQAALEEIKEKTGNPNVELIKLDLEDMDSVREFASCVKNNHPEIKILLNNGGMGDSSDKLKTKEGYSKVMMVNYFGHFLLTHLLLDNLKKGSPSRIINVVSTFLMMHTFDMEDIPMKKIFPWHQQGNNFAYSNSKYALALFSRELGKRLKGTGVTTYSVCPGLVKTDLLSDEPKLTQCVFKLSLRCYGLTPEQCAEEHVNYIAVAKSLSKKTGLTFRFRKPVERINKFLDAAVDASTATTLYERTTKILGIEDYSDLSTI